MCAAGKVDSRSHSEVQQQEAACCELRAPSATDSLSSHAVCSSARPPGGDKLRAPDTNECDTRPKPEARFEGGNKSDGSPPENILKYLMNDKRCNLF